MGIKFHFLKTLICFIGLCVSFQGAVANELDNEPIISESEAEILSGTVIIRVHKESGAIDYLTLDETRDFRELDSVVIPSDESFIKVDLSETNELDSDSGTSSFFLGFGFGLGFRGNFYDGYNGFYPYRSGYRYGGYHNAYGGYNYGSYYYGGRHYRPYYTYGYGGYNYNCYNPYYSYWY